MSTIQVINAKHPSSASNNLVLDNAGNATFAGTAAMASSFLRNRIINGDMRIDQRNAGASVTPVNGGYTLDRWFFSLSQASRITSQRSTIAPSGFTNSTLVTSSSSYAVGASELFLLRQNIEGFNVADLGWGTASAQTVTLSFWARSSLTGTFGGSIRNSAGNRFYPFSYTISAANTFEYKTITIVGDTTGTWATDNTSGIEVMFSLGSGSAVSGTAGSWGATPFYSTTGAVSVVGTNGATFYLTGVQLEVGTAATPFERRQFGTEFMLCQRYFQAGRTYYEQPVTSGQDYAAFYSLGIDMRAAPTVAGSSASAFNFPTTSTLSSVGTRGLYDRRRANGSGPGFFETNITMSAEL